MNDTTRRAVRTSAAAAGIATLGLGIAGPAFAAPALPAAPGSGSVTLPGQDSVSGMEAFDVPAAELPEPFTFAAPSFAPSLEHTPVDEGVAESVSVPADLDSASLPEAPASAEPIEQDAPTSAGSAMQALDMLSAIGDLTSNNMMTLPG